LNSPDPGKRTRLQRLTLALRSRFEVVRHPLPAALLVAAVGLLGGCAGVTDGTFIGESMPEPDGIAYEAVLTGAPSPAVDDTLKLSLRVFTLAHKPPSSRPRLSRRIEADIAQANRILRAEGFYKAAVQGSVEVVEQPQPAQLASLASSQAGSTLKEGTGPNQDTESKEETAQGVGALLRARIKIAAGPRFTIARFDVEMLNADGKAIEGANRPESPRLDGVPIPGTTVARSEAIVGAESALVRWLREHGYPRARHIDRRVVADLNKATLDVVTRIEPGVRVSLGELQFSGLESVRESYLRAAYPWMSGDLYSQERLDGLQRDLASTGLFGFVSVDTAGDAELERNGDAQPRLPIIVNVKEALHRSVGGGVRYTTEFGPSARAFAEHRNLFGEHETARIEVVGSLPLQELNATFTKPAFLLPEQSAVASVVARRELDEAFDELSIGATAGLERRLSEHLRVSAGAGGELARFEGSSADGDAMLFTAPLGLNYDTSDSPLDPTRGLRGGVAITPYVGTLDGETVQFATADVNFSSYLALDDERQFVAAVRGRIGTLVGVERDAAPPSKRLYAGGGGSVRGYESRFVGPLDADGEPLGGRSVLEAGLELRIRVTKNIGVVPFVEAGTVSAAVTPDFEHDVQVAGGVGVRYYTPVGPVRADIAVPLNGRPEDDAFQFYISIGQAF
jgi:translocation and assembly module TamA